MSNGVLVKNSATDFQELLRLNSWFLRYSCAWRCRSSERGERNRYEETKRKRLRRSGASFKKGSAAVSILAAFATENRNKESPCRQKDICPLRQFDSDLPPIPHPPPHERFLPVLRRSFRWWISDSLILLRFNDRPVRHRGIESFICLGLLEPHQPEPE